ncbi:MAG TPA: 2-amino-4-hydroxy-6-hydroxymethyldihydropteridine diphosphokinase [Candidimonas sp.]|nr:2-amino-4-hydroxy-6-hydroxymethyldihydropteridine diphosphokinase [Candidimonas sp.]
MTQAYIGLGANLGDAKASVLQAADALAKTAGITCLRLSPLYRTAPVESSGPDYINAVASIQTGLTAQKLLDIVQAIEERHGRERPYRNAPRTLDLDILLYGNDSIDEPLLVVPHPRMHLRAFVLRPLADLAPDLELPQGALATLLADCADQTLERLPD